LSQELSGLRVSNSKIPVGEELRVEVVVSGLSAGSRCGLRVEFGDQDGEDIRLGADGSAADMVLVRRRASLVGPLIIKAYGKFLPRGLNSVTACGGRELSARVDVVPVQSQSISESLSQPRADQFLAGNQQRAAVTAGAFPRSAAAQAATGSEPRVALVIGNAAYQQSPLRNPVNDSTDVANRLRQLGFTVVERNNLQIRQIGSTLREFRSALKPGGVALVFYAGHGLQIKGENYLPAVDSQISGEEDVPNQSMSVKQIMNVLEQAKTRMNLIFLDACRNNPLTRSFRSSGSGLSRENAPSGTLISFATRPGSTAADGEGRNGVYTAALLKSIDAHGTQPVEIMIKRVVSAVKAETKGQQDPWLEGSIEGDFCFAGCQPTATVGEQMNIGVPPVPPQAILQAPGLTPPAQPPTTVPQQVQAPSSGLLRPTTRPERDVPLTPVDQSTPRSQRNAEVLNNALLGPVSSGRVLEINTGTPKPYGQSTVSKMAWVDQTVARWKANTVVVIEVETRLPQRFISDARQVLSEIAAWSDSSMVSSVRTDEALRRLPKSPVPMNRNWDVGLTIAAAPASPGDQMRLDRFLLPGIRIDIRHRAGLENLASRGHAPNPGLRAVVHGDGDAMLQEVAFRGSDRLENALVVPLDKEVDQFLSSRGQSAKPLPWHHFVVGPDTSLNVVETRLFALVIALSDSAAHHGRRLTVRLQ
jgi:hypothetical protein